MSETKTYVPKSSVKEVTFQSGKSILKLSLKAKEVAGFLMANANDKGYVSLGISQRKAVGQYGDTHCLWLDTWKPDPNRQRQPQPEQNIFAEVTHAFTSGKPPF